MTLVYEYMRIDITWKIRYEKLDEVSISKLLM